LKTHTSSKRKTSLEKEDTDDTLHISKKSKHQSSLEHPLASIPTLTSTHRSHSKIKSKAKKPDPTSTSSSLATRKRKSEQYPHHADEETQQQNQKQQKHEDDTQDNLNNAIADQRNKQPSSSYTVDIEMTSNPQPPNKTAIMSFSSDPRSIQATTSLLANASQQSVLPRQLNSRYNNLPTHPPKDKPTYTDVFMRSSLS